MALSLLKTRGLGLPVNRPSLLAKKDIVGKISRKWVRQILKAKRISLKRKGTWKETKDPPNACPRGTA